MSPFGIPRRDAWEMAADMSQLTRCRIYGGNCEIASRCLVCGRSSTYRRAVLMELIGKFALKAYWAELQEK